jgi:hypothetical protein
MTDAPKPPMSEAEREVRERIRKSQRRGAKQQKDEAETAPVQDSAAAEKPTGAVRVNSGQHAPALSAANQKAAPAHEKLTGNGSAVAGDSGGDGAEGGGRAVPFARKSRTGDKSDGDEAEEAKKESQRNRLIEVVLSRGITFWHDEDANAFAIVPRKDHVERYPVRSRRFKQLLRQMYGASHPNLTASKKFGRLIPGGVSDTAMNEALPTLEAIAQQGPMRQPRVRNWRDPKDGTVWIDIGDDSWALIAVRPSGWDIVQQADVPLIRSRGLRPLSIPENDPEALAKLRTLLNLNPEPDAPEAVKRLADTNFKLVVAFMLAVLWPRGPYAILVVNGEHGSAKSMLCFIIRLMTDPNRAALRKVPRNLDDLLLTARNSRLVPLDNISVLTGRLADLLCVIATGIGDAKRELYSDLDEIIIEACNPIVINGIEGLLTRGDFADRSLSVMLLAIDPDKRRAEEEVEEEAAKVAPGMLALLLDAMATALKNLPGLKLDRLPRMAGFTKLACAAAPAFGWTSDAMFKAIEDNHARTVSSSAAADVVATAVLALLSEQSVAADGSLWSGTAAQLLDALAGFVPEVTARSKAWPKTENYLSGRLKRAQPALRQAGIEITWDRKGHVGRRTISLKVICKSSSASSAANLFNGLDADDALGSSSAGSSADQDEDLDWDDADDDADGDLAAASAGSSAANDQQHSDNAANFRYDGSADDADDHFHHILPPDIDDDADEDDEERL